jgi:hypothetical protein
MVYTSDFALALGPAYTGIADLRAQLVDTAGASTGAAVSTGFVEIGTGFYLWNYASIPDGHRGGVKFYQNAAPTTYLAFSSINPEELENVDAKISTRATSATAATAIGTRVLTGTKTYDDAQRLTLASQGGKTSGAVAGSAGTFTIRDSEDTKDAVVAAYDANGNRTSVTLSLTP